EAQAQANAIKRRELEWAFAKLSDLDERERRVVEALASRLVGKMLHGPIQWLKAQAESGVAGELDYSPEALVHGHAAPAMVQIFYRGVGEGEAVDGDADEVRLR